MLLLLYMVASHLKIIIPVGTAMIIVGDVKYACLWTSISTVIMRCAHTKRKSDPVTGPVWPRRCVEL